MRQSKGTEIKTWGLAFGAVGGTVATAGYPVTVLSSGSTPNRDFANYTVGTVSGTKFEDRSADGSTSGDPTLGGWVIRAYTNAATPVLVSSTTTSAVDGSYSLSLQPGSYLICEVLQANWTQSKPTGTDCGAVGGTVATARSEERRVGKECRSRRAPDH